VCCAAGVLGQLRDEGSLTGWRGELYPVLTAFHAEPLALVERAAAPYFGIRAYGVHVNGYVETGRGEELWVATRSRSKPTWPGKLDHIVAGGQVRACLPPSHAHSQNACMAAIATCPLFLASVCPPDLCRDRTFV
jgi:hypothetical protein